MIPAFEAMDTENLPVFQALMQLYFHDFDDYFKEGPESSGLYALEWPLERYIDQPGYWAYLARINGRAAGFVLFSDRVVFQADGRYIDEFFVVRGLRGGGLGRRMAHYAFDQYQGYWEVVQIKPNAPATAFWRRVIGGYTGGQYEEFETDEPEMGHVWQAFNSGAAGAGRQKP